MLCCIPVKHHFSPKSSKSSGRSPSTSQRSRSAMPSTVQTDVDAGSESGIFYLVPNKNGPGKSLIRRRPPPRSSPPLPEDFDAMTVGGQSTFTRGGGGVRPGWETHGRTGGPGSVSPPVYDGGATYTAGATLTRKAGSSMDGYGTDVKSWLKSSESSPGRSRHGRGHSSEDFGDQRGYVDDMKRRFVGETPSMALSPTRARRELSRNSALTKERDMTGRIDRDRIGPPARLGSIPRPAGNPDLIQSRAANEFQEVNRRILEDGPERTVLISTWREQVADAVDTQTVVDVYYLNEDDYAEGAEEENQDTKATSSRRGSLPLPSAPSLNLLNLEEIRSETQGLPEPRSITESFSSERGPTVPPKSNRSYRVELTRDRSGSGASVSKASSRAKSPETHHTRRSSNHSNSSHLISSGGRNLPINTNLSSPRSSTPVKSRQDPSSLAGRSSRNIHQPVTPSEMYGINPMQPGPSFISTNDLASTIGTIKSASVTAFEDVLSSCEPSLLHISPALNNLGITSDTHLKAITKMSEDTRDKVVKEEALKQGITVMEWAILLDKLQAL